MSYLKNTIHSFLDDIPKRSKKTPFGGAVVALSVLSNLQLLNFTLSFSIKKREKNNEIIQKIQSYIDLLEKKKLNLIGEIDQDILVVGDIIDAYQKNDNFLIKKSLENGVFYSYRLLKNISDISDIIEDSSSHINEHILSDLFIVNEMHYSHLLSIRMNVFINLKPLKQEPFLYPVEEYSEMEENISLILTKALEKKLNVNKIIENRLGISLINLKF